MPFSPRREERAGRACRNNSWWTLTALWIDFKLQRRPSGQVTLGHALRTLKGPKLVDGEATMVPRQGAPWGWGLQTVALADGETLFAHFSPLRLDINPFAEC